MPETPVKFEKVWMKVGVEFAEMGTSKMFGAEKSLTRTEPEGRTTRFSIQVPLGNWWMTSTGRFGVWLGEEVAIGLARLMIGRRATRQRLEVEKNIANYFWMRSMRCADEVPT
jgi:hypothetical protein